MESSQGACGASLRWIFWTRIERGWKVLVIRKCFGWQADDHRILVTHDFQTMPAHFADFLMERSYSPGVCLVKQRTAIGSVIEALLLVWALSSPDEWRNLILELPF